MDGQAQPHSPNALPVSLIYSRKLCRAVSGHPRVTSTPLQPSGPELKKIVDALLSAFPREDDLEQMVEFQLGQTLGHFVPQGDLRTRALALVRWAICTGSLGKLLDGAQQANPGNPDLNAVVAWLATQPSAALPPPQPPPEAADGGLLSTSSTERRSSLPWTLAIVSIAIVTATMLAVFLAPEPPASSGVDPRGAVVANSRTVPASVVVGGNIADQAGDGLAGAEVWVDGATVKYTTPTSGNFRLILPPGSPNRVRLHVRLKGFVDYTEPVSIPVDNFQIRLKKQL